MHGLQRMLVDDVVALYVDPKGPYPLLVREWYDEVRDAKTYRGPHPVVAHPPCGPWSRLRFLCTKQDATCGPHAIATVRRFGGVLEHPAQSTLFSFGVHPMPRPNDPPDVFGGRTYEVCQVAWGHQCKKPTWLYVVGVPDALVRAGIRTGGKPTHRVTSGPRGPKLPSLDKGLVSLSPWRFAAWLVRLARAVR